jgi:hypothetical protein
MQAGYDTLPMYFIICSMGFFDSIVDDAAKESSSATPASTAVATANASSQASAPPVVQETSDLIILDDAPSAVSSDISFSPDAPSEVVTPIESEQIANTAAEMFQPEVSITSEASVTFGTSTSESEVDAVTSPVQEESSVSNISASDIPSTDATLTRAIEAFQLDLARIQVKAKESYDTEKRLLEEKKQKEEEMKQIIADLDKAAAEARKSALETEKSGARTEKLIQLFQSQIGAESAA